MMNRAWGSTWRIRVMSAAPLVSGRRRSMSVRSGLWAAWAATAASPSPASATTSMSGSWLIITRRPTRTTLWSSTTRTRIFGASGITQILEVHAHFYLGSPSGVALDAEAPEQRGPLAHAGEAEVAALHAHRGPGIK